MSCHFLFAGITYWLAGIADTVFNCWCYFLPFAWPGRVFPIFLAAANTAQNAANESGASQSKPGKLRCTGIAWPELPYIGVV